MTSHKESNHDLPNIRGRARSGPKHSLGFRISHRARKAVAISACAAIAFVAAFVAAAAIEILGSVNVVPSVHQLKAGAKTPKPEDIYKGKTLNVLVLGQDTRSGAGNAAIGGDDPEDAENHQSDTAIVAQIAADRSYINLVPIPRDSMVNAPACTTSSGKTIPARHYVMFNSIFATGYQQGGDVASAASCALTAVNTLTGLDVQQFVVADFNGLKDVIDALGGVNICVPQDTWDGYTGVDIKRGLQHLDGTQATQYARMRHGTGTDGSDIMRTTRQQYLIKSLMNEAKSSDVYSNFGKMFQLSKTSLSALQFSQGLGNVMTLYGLADSMQHIDASHVYSRTLPVEPDPDYPQARVRWSSDAKTVWAALRAEKPLTDAELNQVRQQNLDAAGKQAPSQREQGQRPQAQTQTQGAQGTSPSASANQQETPDPKTGLITRGGQLIDPVTGGIVDSEDGTIRDAGSGQYIGIADRYLSATVCAVPAQK
ncbi:transcriptional regulator [Bifidobacterium actinocoloniiforme DSM 22766]|uniref:Transcriptional regulator n=1 Tax=Bifidobacterium actinocoloniiforme DSM 22766 TaxID=1437605 RepID=A0A086Z025_9BIFI|nr:LCP family protein [Bifidobacterium actinocoloniiforme]AKV55142.1 transcriptional regulator [Bifidobacterium actinocoloniiforme DSM 22766]KFI39875.1 transcriptional regulator [Bifidobacterium actinocoloniiforme DSM 22766]